MAPITTSMPPMPPAIIPSTNNIIAQVKEPTYLEPTTHIIPIRIVMMAKTKLPKKEIGENIINAEPNRPSIPNIMIIIPPINAKIYPALVNESKESSPPCK